MSNVTTIEEKYAIKMDNDQYLVLEQTDNDLLEGYTVENIDFADIYPLSEAEEIVNAILNETKIQEIFKVFIFKNKPTAYVEVKKTIEILSEQPI